MEISGRLYRQLVDAHSFRRDIVELLTEEEYGALCFEIARSPRIGVVVQGTGGIRKLRWARRGMGKRGGVRVIYYSHADDLPIFMLAAYSKSEKIDLSPTEKRLIKGLVAEMIKEFSG